jgi:hypothetical protein
MELARGTKDGRDAKHASAVFACEHSGGLATVAFQRTGSRCNPSTRSTAPANPMAGGA